MNQILLRSIKLNHAEFIPPSSQKLSNGSKKIKMQPGSQWLCTDLHPSDLGGFQLYVSTRFLPILWHLQSLQQLLRTWLHFQASQDWGRKKRNFWFSPTLNAVMEQSPKCKQHGILQRNISTSLCLWANYRKWLVLSKMWNPPLKMTQKGREWRRWMRRKGSAYANFNFHVLAPEQARRCLRAISLT